MKYYGVFRFVAKKDEHKNEMLWKIICQEKHNQPIKSMNSVRQLATSRNDEALQSFISAWRTQARIDAKTSRCTIFKTKYIIHECDENGIFVPSKKELKEAHELYFHDQEN